MRRTTDPIAIFLSDIHLSLKPPIWRSVEEDWLAVTKKYLDEVAQLRNKWDCPIFCAGDIFDKWNSPPELINYAMRHIPYMLTIPGQHDLPFHNMKLIEKSAYWTLVQGCRIKHLEEGPFYTITNNILLYPFPFGAPITPPDRTTKYKDEIHIALVHQYNWIKKKAHPRAHPEDAITQNRKELMKYDVVVFGDNHKSFSCHLGKTLIWNCGSFMRRKVDEVNHNPRLGLLYKDGTIKPWYLDTDEDKVLPVSKVPVTEDLNMADFFEELDTLGDSAFDFKESVMQYLKFKAHEKNINPKVKLLLEQAMENSSE